MNTITKYLSRLTIGIFCLLFQHFSAQQLIQSPVKPKSFEVSARFLLKNRFVYACGENKDSIHFSLTDLDTKTTVFKQNNIAPLKYQSKPHINGQSLQIAVDTGNSVYKNRIYISWADQKNGPKNWDVFLVYSDDAGAHWTEPILVTYFPNHRNQTMPKIFIDPNNGQLFLLFADEQFSTKKHQLDVQLAFSLNGGLKFNYVKLNNEPLIFKHENIFLDFEKKENQFFVLWSDSPSAYFYQKPLNEATENLTNPLPGPAFTFTTNTWLNFKDSLHVDFYCSEDIQLKAELTRPLDPKFKALPVTSRNFKKGNNRLLIDMKAHSIEKGNYVLTLYYHGYNKFIWITDNE